MVKFPTLRVLVDQPRGGRRFLILGSLGLRRLWVVHAGERALNLGRQVRAIPLARVVEELEPLR